MPHLTFLGAARTVTGSKYLLESNGTRVLVDCGLFQGLKELRERNWQPLPVDPSTIDAVVLTTRTSITRLPAAAVATASRAHLLHPGHRPPLRIVPRNSGRLQEEDAESANRGGYAPRPALPLYTEDEAIRALLQLQLIGYDRPMPVAAGLEVMFVNAGHLLGSAYARVAIGNGEARRTILFGGDLGRYDRPVLPDPAPVDAADILLVESTYGDRLHEPSDDGARLAGIVNDTAARGGKLVIPASPSPRGGVLYRLRKLEDERRIPELPVFSTARWRLRRASNTPRGSTSSTPRSERRPRRRPRTRGRAPSAGCAPSARRASAWCRRGRSRSSSWHRAHRRS
jgi:metallo-beta-lactamase family protein